MIEILTHYPFIVLWSCYIITIDGMSSEILDVTVHIKIMTVF